jgi:hypothetical protein
MSLKEMRDELRALRKESVKAPSRMKKADIASELERLRGVRESVPPVASTAGAKPKKMEAKIADVKVAKEKEFPVAPVDEKKKGGKKPSGLASKTASADSAPKKSDKMAKLKAMLEAMSSDEE